MAALNIFCSAMEDDLFVSSGTRAFQEQELDDDRQTGQGMSVEVNPRSYEVESFASVLHLATGGSGSGSCARTGDRTPASDEGDPCLHSVEWEPKLF